LHSTGVPAATILEQLGAIDALHNHFKLSSPVNTQLVQETLRGVLDGQETARIEPPRSWSKADRVVWGLLPRAVQEIVERRAREDSKAVRTAQNAAARATQPKGDYPMIKKHSDKGATHKDSNSHGLTEKLPYERTADTRDVFKKVTDVCGPGGDMLTGGGALPNVGGRKDS
jgi:hypothetical protein